jgi:hypothetical protein
MPATLTTTDNGDLTVTAALAGGGAGDAVDLYATRLDLSDAAGAWASGPAVTLDGTGAASAVLTLPSRGLWHFLAVANGVPWGTAARVLVTDGGATPLAVLTQVRRAIKARIETLGLPFQLVAENIARDDEANLAYPCVILTSENVAESEDGGLNLTDDVGYPVRVTIADRIDAQDVVMMPSYEYWRETIQRAFRSHRLDSPFENLICRIEPDAIVDPVEPLFQKLVSEFTIRAVCRMFRL